MENIEEIVRTLSGILENIKKQGTKKYKVETLLQKLKDIENLKIEFEKLETSPDIDYKELTILKTKFQKLYTETKGRLTEQKNDQDKSEQSGSNNISTQNMSEFDINTSLKVVPEFTGNYRDLPSFLKITELIYKTLNEQSKKTFIEFIREVKLNNKVRTAIGILDPIDNFDKLQIELTKLYKNPLTIPEMYSKLNCCTQRNQNVATFSDHILQLISELNTLRIAELEGTVTNERKDDVIRNNQKYGLTIFKNNLNDNLRQAICLTQTKTLQEAINLAKDLERTTSTSGQIMFFNQNNIRGRNNYRGHNNTNKQGRNTFNQNYVGQNLHHGNNYRGNHGHRGQNHNANNYFGANNNNYNRNNYNNNFRYNNNFGNQYNRGHNRGQNNNRGNTYNRGNFNNNNNRIRVMQQGNEFAPEEGQTNESQSPGTQN